MLDQLTDVRSLRLTAWAPLADIHPATRRLLAGWGYRYSVWHLRRFSVAKRNGIVICFLQAARAERTDGIVEMHRLKTPDALQAATAIHSEATGFVTKDSVFERLKAFETLVLEQSAA